MEKKKSKARPSQSSQLTEQNASQSKSEVRKKIQAQGSDNMCGPPFTFHAFP